MEAVLTIMGGALGIAIPYLFIYVISKGIMNAPFENTHKIKLKKNLHMLIGTWTLMIWILSLTGTLSYQPGDTFPRFLIALFAPVLVGLLFIKNKNYQTILASIPLYTLVSVQAFRLAGSAFLMVVYLGILPAAFAAGGYGDILTGSLSIVTALLILLKRSNTKLFFWLFNIIGLLDLCNVAFLILEYYPIWNDLQPNSAPMADFSLVMIPVIAAPIAMLLHIYSIIKELKGAI